MAEELLSLKWNNHQAHFVDILTFLREQEIFIDATLACGGKLYPAHKFVLSTCSDYFKQMFTKNPNKHPIVFMKDVTCRDLEALLDFMYNGEVNVPQSSLGSLIKTAEGLQIKGLAVPDDPPFSKRDHSVLKDRRDRDQKSRRDKSFSPPPKRLRERDRSPLLNSSASPFPNHSQSRIRSPHNSSNNQLSVNTGLSKLEETLDEDSRTSIHSGISEHSHSVSNKKTNVNSQSQLGNEDNTGESENSNQPTTNEPSPGPSGLHRTTQSKEEELDIKQEDDMGLVDLGGEDDDDWRDGEGMEGNSLDDGGTSVSSANAQGFSDVLLPLSDGSLPSGDPAMLMGCSASGEAVSYPSQDISSSPVWLFPSSLSSSTACTHLAFTSMTNDSHSVGQQRFMENLGIAGVKCGSYRQDKIRNQITVIDSEINSLESSIAGNISENQINLLRGRIESKQMERNQLNRELDRLIRGQMRQRKFRAKLKQITSNSEVRLFD